MGTFVLIWGFTLNKSMFKMWNNPSALYILEWSRILQISIFVHVSVKGFWILNMLSENNTWIIVWYVRRWCYFLESTMLLHWKWHHIIVHDFSVCPSICTFSLRHNILPTLRFTLYCSTSSDTIWWHISGSTLDQVLACCLAVPRHYLNQCWYIISKMRWHSP